MIFAAIISMGFLASCASFILKKSTSDGLSIKSLILNPYFYLGGGLYVLSALLNLYLLKQLPYSIVVPLGSLTYIWTLGISYRFLGERVTRQKLLGIALIFIGVSLIAVTI